MTVKDLKPGVKLKTPSQVFVKNTNCLYINCVFWANQARKDRFWIFWIEKNDFRPEKRRFNKSTNNRSFPKGLVHAAFVKKVELFIKFFGGQIKPGKVVFG